MTGLRGALWRLGLVRVNGETYTDFMRRLTLSLSRDLAAVELADALPKALAAALPAAVERAIEQRIDDLGEAEETAAAEGDCPYCGSRLADVAIVSGEEELSGGDVVLDAEIADVVDAISAEEPENPLPTALALATDFNGLTHLDAYRRVRHLTADIVRRGVDGSGADA